MLEARGLCKSYGDRAVVADLSLSVGAGEIVGLLGPNGAGKSTTVAMLCGLVGADRGEVFIGTGASRLALDENAHAAKRRIGVVPQELSIYENLGARGEPRAVRRPLRARRRTAARASRRRARAWSDSPTAPATSRSRSAAA